MSTGLLCGPHFWHQAATVASAQQLPHGTAACPPALGTDDRGSRAGMPGGDGDPAAGFVGRAVNGDSGQDFEVENLLEDVLDPEESASLSLRYSM